MMDLKKSNSDPEHSRLIVIAGPTAVGKTAISIQLAQYLNTEILSADSRQFYRELKIGVAAPSETELNTVPHHFIGNLSIHDYYNVSRYETDALALLNRLFLTKTQLLMVGGSGLYINAVCHGIDELPDPDPDLRKELQNNEIEELRNRLKLLDPEYYAIVDLANSTRLIRAIEVCLQTGKSYSSLRNGIPKPRNFNILKIGLSRERAELNQIIGLRVDQMIEQGLLEEARSLYPLRHHNALNTVGYKELFEYFDGKITLEQAITDIKTHTRRYAKRQMTWFMRDKEIHWFHPDDIDQIKQLIIAGS